MAKRGTFTKLKKLLLSRNYEELDLGIQLAHALADVAIFDKLVSGTTIGMRGDMQELEPSTTFGSATLGQWRLYTLLNLVAVAPEGSEVAALRDELTSLRLYAGDGDYRCRTRQIATYLGSFPNLTSLDVWSCTVLDCGAIEKMTSLETLELRRCGFDGPVRLAPSVRKVKITRHDWTPDIDVLGDLETWSNVEEIYALGISVPDPRVLSKLKSVRVLTLRDARLPKGAREIVQQLPKLEKVTY